MTHTQAYARPSSDITDGSWLNSSSNNTDLFSYIDGASAGSDYISVQHGMSGSLACEVGLETVDAPGVNTGHKVTFRASEDSDSNSITLVVKLRQDTMTIDEFEEDSFGAAETFEHSISESDAANITDYSALRLQFTSTDGMGGTTTKVYHAFLEFPAPDALILAPVASKANLLGMFD